VSTNGAFTLLGREDGAMPGGPAGRFGWSQERDTCGECYIYRNENIYICNIYIEYIYKILLRNCLRTPDPGVMCSVATVPMVTCHCDV